MSTNITGIEISTETLNKLSSVSVNDIPFDEAIIDSLKKSVRITESGTSVDQAYKEISSEIFKVLDSKQLSSNKNCKILNLKLVSTRSIVDEGNANSQIDKNPQIWQGNKAESQTSGVFTQMFNDLLTSDQKKQIFGEIETKKTFSPVKGLSVSFNIFIYYYFNLIFINYLVT